MRQTVKLMFRVTAVMVVFAFIAVNRVLAQTGQNPRNNPDPARHADALAANQLKPPVLRLGRLILSFVDNPFFKEASVVDTQLTTKARRDLEDIIELSGQIKKRTAQLGKSRQ